MVRLSRTFWLVIVSGSLACCASDPSLAQKRYVAGSLGKEDQVAAAVIREVNAYRQRQGKANLSVHAGLAQLARGHCDTLGSQYRRASGRLRVHHGGFSARSCQAISRYQVTGIAENVAAGSWPLEQAASQLVRAWQQSPSHDRNLRGDWRYVGVDVQVAEDGTVFATQLFGK